MTQNGEHKPTINGVIKGRPGKGKVLSLGQRKTCYAKPTHRMTEDNIFRYTPKSTENNPKPLERGWCRRCRADSRKRGCARRLEMVKVEARRVKAELAKLMRDGKAKAAKREQRKADRVAAQLAEAAA